MLGNVYWTLNLPAKIRLFGTLKMFYCDGVGSDGVGLTVATIAHLKIKSAHLKIQGAHLILLI